MATPLDTSCSDDLAAAYRRLNAAYQQALRYAEDVRVLYQQLQRGIYQSLLGLANVFGQRPDTTVVGADAATLKLYAPAHLRSGLLFSARFHVYAHRELKKATLVLD